MPTLRNSFSPGEKVLDLRRLYETGQTSEEVFPAICNRIASKKRTQLTHVQKWDRNLIFFMKSTKQVKGQWNIEWLVAQSLPPKTFISLWSCLLMPVELAGMRQDLIDDLGNILQEILRDFESIKCNGRTRFVGYIDQKEDHFIVGYQKNGREEIDCLKICVK